MPTNGMQIFSLILSFACTHWQLDTLLGQPLNNQPSKPNHKFFVPMLIHVAAQAKGYAFAYWLLGKYMFSADIYHHHQPDLQLGFMLAGGAIQLLGVSIFTAALPALLAAVDDHNLRDM
ncbi:hypothetical protein EJB05_50655 [Eragrostis curvula]|uniref:Uncharacterized protein n=1 Tax=Eragrostis curvula TaxID=38414 RepID=A0A5J9SXX1_9POAL|nr:hypothetical protein EJB05_50655 [Eragrostis curvula]